MLRRGFPVGHFVGYRTDGIFQNQNEIFGHINADGDLLQPKAEPGDLRFVDINSDGVINSDDIGDIGSPWPAHIIGLSLNADYKGFDIGMMFTAQLGNEVYRTYERSDVTYTNYQTFWLDRWTEENPGGTYPRLVSNDPNNNQRPSDFYVEDASFLRLRNLQIGYSLPSRMLEKIKIQELRMRSNSFICSSEGDDRFSQVKGRNMRGLFTDNSLQTIFVSGNGQSIYYTKNSKEELTGVNRADCSDMVIKIDENRIQEINLITQPDATLYPLSELSAKELILKGFNWRQTERPISKYDILTFH